MNLRNTTQGKAGIPPIIYLQWFGDAIQPDPDDPVVVSEVSWSLHPIFDSDIEYKVNQPIALESARFTEALVDAAENVLTTLFVDTNTECLNRLWKAVQPFRRPREDEP